MKAPRIVFHFALFGCIFLWVACGLAGESGQMSCSTPGCGFKQSLTIGGGMKSPSITGYCPSSKKFVRLKLKSWGDYRKPQQCPGSREPLQPIYGGSDLARIPCPQCGHLTLKYKRRIMFD